MTLVMGLMDTLTIDWETITDMEISFPRLSLGSKGKSWLSGLCHTHYRDDSQVSGLESMCLATLAERTCLEQLQKTLKDCASQQASPSRNRRLLFLNNENRNYRVLHTPLLNLAAATQIANSIQPSGSVVGEGVR